MAGGDYDFLGQNARRSQSFSEADVRCTTVVNNRFAYIDIGIMNNVFVKEVVKRLQHPNVTVDP